MKRPMTIVLTAAVLAAMTVYGILLMRHAATMPAFTDSAAHARLFWESPPSLGNDEARRAFKAFTADWHRRISDLRTSKWVEHDRGRWLIALAATLAAVLSYLQFARCETVATLTTPRTVGRILGIGLLGLALMHLGVWQELLDEHDRQLIPPFADSMGIPMFGLIFTFFILSALAMIGSLLLRQAVLPESLWLWNPEKAVKSWLLTVLFGIPAALLAFAMLDNAFIHGGSALAPLAGILLLYALLSARTALVSKTLESPA